MSYQVIVPKPVQKQLDSLPKNLRDRAAEREKTAQAKPAKRQRKK